MRLNAIIGALFIAASVPAFSQTAPTATAGGMRFEAGAGFSDYNSDLGDRQLKGAALWADGYPAQLPGYLRGLGLEAEARVVRTRQLSADEIGSFRQSSIGGGPTYSWNRFHNFRPYAKVLVNFAWQDFYVGAQVYRHESQIAYAPGGGVEYRAYRNLWARADYEYQIWPNPFNNPGWYLDPQGFTVGLSVDMRALHRR